MQFDPVEPKFNLPGIKRLKLKFDEPLSKFAFKFKLRHYSMGGGGNGPQPRVFTDSAGAASSAGGRGLHSSTFQLNVSALRGIGGAFKGCSGGVRGVRGCFLGRNGSG